MHSTDCNGERRKTEKSPASNQWNKHYSGRRGGGITAAKSIRIMSNRRTDIEIRHGEDYRKRGRQRIKEKRSECVCGEVGLRKGSRSYIQWHEPLEIEVVLVRSGSSI